MLSDAVQHLLVASLQIVLTEKYRVVSEHPSAAPFQMEVLGRK